MSSDVYIFGYQSILAVGSLATSIAKDSGQFAPARLPGYARSWGAVRSFANNETKRYVHAEDWRIADRVAFASLIRSAHKSVNGVCRRIPSDQLAALDYREQGYRRIDVSAIITPYNGFELDKSVPCFAYIDSGHSARPAIVSRAYYNMGYLGAAHLSKVVPGFLEDYLNSTEHRPHLADDLVFVFISADGRHLWLLDERDSSLILLQRFSSPQITPLTQDPAELCREITAHLKWLDVRHRDLSNFSYNGRVPEAIVRELLSATDNTDLAKSRFWLCRLAAVECRRTAANRMAALANDVDVWVSRAAKLKNH
jgi:hypothetical protein